MKGTGLLNVPRLVAGFAVAFLVAGLGAAGATPANAQGLGTNDDRSADAEVGAATLRAALERDLGLSGAALDELLAASAEAAVLDTELQDQLGARFAGSWFDRSAGALTVAVTDSGAASLATAAGAETIRVDRGERQLTSIMDDVAELVEAEPAARTDVFSWSTDAPSNQVVVTVRAGQADAADALVAEYGDAVRIEESAVAPQLAQDYPWLDGGIPYNGCSTGFNVQNPDTGERYFLTAGHCGASGQIATAGNGVEIGPFVASFFPGFDDALVQVTNTSFWLQGPHVFTYPGFIDISGFTDAPVGTPVCKSGRTTGWTCGTITAKDASVDYVDGDGNPIGTVDGLTQHNACVEPGDSGGSNVNVAGTPAAEGMTSGAALFNVGGALRCGQAVSPPQPNVSWYFPIADSLGFYGPSFGVSLF